MNDRILGYIVMVVFMAVVLGTVGYVADLLYNPAQRRVIVLDEIGSLQVDDPLKILGTTVGTISAIAWDTIHGRVYLTVDFPEPIDVYANYSITTAEKGVLGERYLILNPGDSSLLKPTDTLTTRFIPGVAEVIGRAGQLETVIHTILELVAELAQGTEEKPPLRARFDEIVYLVDSLSLKLQTAAGVLNRELQGTLDTLDHVVSSTGEFVHAMASEAPALVAAVEKRVGEMDHLITRLEALVTGLSDITERLLQKDNLLWGDMIGNMQREIDTLRETLRELREKSARLKLRISFMR